MGRSDLYSLVCWEEHQRLHQLDNLLPREPEKCECSSLWESSEESQLSWMFSTREKGAMTGPTIIELDERIAMIRENINELVEQAAAYSGAEDENRTADRIAEQE